MLKNILIFILFVMPLAAENNQIAQENDLGLHSQYLPDKSVHILAKPYLLPKTHKLQRILDKIFAKSRVTENETTFAQAGFVDLSVRSQSYLRIATHPKVPGYVFKVYLDSEPHVEGAMTGLEWLIHRCRGAAFIQKIIKKNNLQHFIVPKKWLYALPKNQKTNGSTKQSYILIAQKMNLASYEKTKRAWSSKVTPKLLKELYCILKTGYGSVALLSNIPYTKDRKFTFIDTEFPKRNFNLAYVSRRLSDKMATYWDKLIVPHNPNSLASAAVLPQIEVK